jgi:hypothetical protein
VDPPAGAPHQSSQSKACGRAGPPASSGRLVIRGGCWVGMGGWVGGRVGGWVGGAGLEGMACAPWEEPNGRLAGYIRTEPENCGCHRSPTPGTAPGRGAGGATMPPHKPWPCSGEGSPRGGGGKRAPAGHEACTPGGTPQAADHQHRALPMQGPARAGRCPTTTQRTRGATGRRRAPRERRGGSCQGTGSTSPAGAPPGAAPALQEATTRENII